MNFSRTCIGGLVVFTIVALNANAADDAWKPVPRRLPPAGVKVDDAARQEIEAGLAKLQDGLKSFKGDATFLPDVQVYEKAVRYALLHGEFWKPEQTKTALNALRTASDRLSALSEGKHPWADARGQFVLGYTSDIDGSPQPYGVEIPADLDLTKPTRLYVWLHGRGEQETDLHFIAGRSGRPGQIKPTDGIVIHPFGRQCIGWKSAGEQDVLDAIDAVSKRFKIDADRVALMGFSMGGAGAWHVGAHYTDRFAVVHAGAGFVDTAKFLKLTPDKFPPPIEQTLWGLYDVPDYVHNLFNVPVITYGGETDGQRAAGEIMVQTYKLEGRELPMLIGPKMGHKYDPESLAKVMEFTKAALDKGRPIPEKVSLQTRTLRYSRMYWVAASGLDEHWKDSRIDADASAVGKLVITTRNISRMLVWLPPSWNGYTSAKPTEATIDGQSLSLPFPKADPWRFEKAGGKWRLGFESDESLRKRPTLQGPIDDAFVEPFLVVTPSGKCASPAVQKWVDFELAHFHERWPAVFRGDLRVKADVDVTEDDLAKYHVVCWGDAQSNALIAKLAGRLPAKTEGGKLVLGSNSVDAATHVPLLIYPNPLNVSKYVVLNSGPTFREQDDANNSLQNPKLGDWAIIDVTVPPDTKTPGRVVGAGFFDEAWKFKGQ